MIGIKGKGAKLIEIPPMDLKKYGALPYEKVKLFKFRVRGLESLRAGSFLQYSLIMNPSVIAAFVDYTTSECFIAVNEKENKDSAAKMITESPVYSDSEFLKYEADFESEEEIYYEDILKKRFNLEFLE